MVLWLKKWPIDVEIYVRLLNEYFKIDRCNGAPIKARDIRKDNNVIPGRGWV
jgi:hypothetical protein